MTQFSLNSWMIEDLERRVRQLEQRVYGGESREADESESGAALYSVCLHTVEALRYTGHNWKAIEEFFGDTPWLREMAERETIPGRVPSGRLCIPARGYAVPVFASPGDWLVKDAQGSIFPLEHTVFTRLYQERYAA